MRTVGNLVYQFFEHHLKAEKGLASTSIRSYRDGIRLFLLFLARENRRPISKLRLSDLSADNVRAFLAHLEAERGNGIRARNHRLAMLHTFFAYAGGQEPMVLPEAERVAAIPRKRAQPAATYYLERDDVERLFDKLPRIRACSPASQATSPPIGAQSMRNRPRKSVSGGITAQIAPCKRTSERCAKAPCNWPINMELSRHDIGTCKGRSGRRAQRRRAGRRSCNDARARAATKAVELHREARVGRPGERGGAIFFHGSSSWHEDRLDVCIRWRPPTDA
ncbi:site-specific integrase [Mesorhizobium cantuariense]|uniref:Site-specific integrase n=1 Tax=Mesorhizobium cantuariense TaxID=1300275 RepID=A0ABV7MIH5_9HYPH